MWEDNRGINFLNNEIFESYIAPNYETGSGRGRVLLRASSLECGRTSVLDLCLGLCATSQCKQLDIC